MRMDNSKCLFFAFSENTEASKWMPWECGYFDGKVGRVAICPIIKGHNPIDEYQGQEFLGLYPYITIDEVKGKNYETIFINESPDCYVSITGWINGKDPYNR